MKFFIGLKSTDEQYERYFERFNYIYQCEKMKKNGIQQIYISGDNDIGGEYKGDRNEILEKRFESYFGKIVEAFKLTDYIKILKLDIDNTHSYYEGKKQRTIQKLYSDLKEEEKKDNLPKFSMILNHMSLLMRSETEFFSVIIV